MPPPGQPAPGRGCPSRAAPAAPPVGDPLEPGDPLAGDRLDRPRGHRVDADPFRTEIAREVARHRLRAPPSPRPSSRRSATPPSRRSRARRSRRRSSINGSIPTANCFSENALVCTAVATLSHSVLRKLPPSASVGANAIACRNPSIRPHREASSSRTASICSGMFTSISRTSGSGRRLATFSVRLTRPPEVREDDLGAQVQAGLGRRESDRLGRQHAGDQQALLLE